MIRFDLAPPEPWFTISILALLALAAWSYRGLWPGKRRAALALILLRALALIGVLLALYQPSRESSFADPSGRRLLVLYDVSASMGVADASGRPRGEAPRGAVRDFVETWKQNGEVSLFAFDDGFRPIDDPTTIPDTGARTNLAGAFQSARGFTGGLAPTAVLVVTDGVGNRSGDILTAADRLQAPLFFLMPTAGDPGARIVSATAPAAAAIGATIDLSSRVAGTGSMILSLYRVRSAATDGAQEAAEVLVEKRTVTAGEHRFSVPALEAGIVTLRLRIEGRDSYPVDNVRTLATTILPPRDVLFVTGRLSWEYKHVREALESIQAPRVHVVAFDETRAVYVSGDGRRFARSSDWTTELLAPVAVLVALDAEANALPSSAVALLDEMASGGRLGIAAAGTSLAPSAPLATILPIRSRDPATGAGGLAVEPAGHALARSAARLVSDEGAFTLSPTAGARAMAHYAGGGGPAILVGRVGASRAVCIGFETWKTAWLGGDSRAVRTFWRDLVDYVSPSPTPPVRLTSPSLAILPGEEARIAVRSETTISRAIVHLEGAGLSERSVRSDPTTIRVVPSAEGECRIALLSDKDTTPMAHAYVSCVERSLEYDGADSDPTILATLAARTGGRVVEARDLPSVAASVADRSTVTRRRRLDLWDHPALLILLVAALAAEWGLRRRLGFR